MSIKMKVAKKMKKAICVTLAIGMVAGCLAGNTTDAAKKTKLKTKTLKMNVGDKKKIQLKNAKKSKKGSPFLSLLCLYLQSEYSLCYICLLYTKIAMAFVKSTNAIEFIFLHSLSHRQYL